MAFGSTRRAGVRAEDDETLRHLVEAQTEAVCIVAKSSEIHVVDALRTTLDEAVAMVADSVEFLRANDLRVFLDAEHFFDGYKANPEFTLRILQAAEEAGAETLVLCDTNGGTLPYEVERIVAHRPRPVRDPGGRPLPQRQRLRRGQLAGRRGGRAPPMSRAASTATASGPAMPTWPPSCPICRSSSRCRPSRRTACRSSPRWPTTSPSWSTSPPIRSSRSWGPSVFAHKAGLHTSAIARRSDAYEHVSPDLVGNGTRFVVSEMAGRSTLAMKAEELGLELDSDAMTSVLDSLKRLEYEGYHFEVADGSLELLLRNSTGWRQSFFELESYRVIADQGTNLSHRGHRQARVGGERIVATAEGNGPVNALDGALRRPSAAATLRSTGSTWSTTGSGSSTRPRAPAR